MNWPGLHRCGAGAHGETEFGQRCSRLQAGLQAGLLKSATPYGARPAAVRKRRGPRPRPTCPAPALRPAPAQVPRTPDPPPPSLALSSFPHWLWLSLLSTKLGGTSLSYPPLLLPTVQRSFQTATSCCFYLVVIWKPRRACSRLVDSGLPARALCFGRPSPGQVIGAEFPLPKAGCLNQEGTSCFGLNLKGSCLALFFPGAAPCKPSLIEHARIWHLVWRRRN